MDVNDFKRYLSGFGNVTEFDFENMGNDIQEVAFRMNSLTDKPDAIKLSLIKWFNSLELNYEWNVFMYNGERLLVSFSIWPRKKLNTAPLAGDLRRSLPNLYNLRLGNIINFKVYHDPGDLVWRCDFKIVNPRFSMAETRSLIFQAVRELTGGKFDVVVQVKDTPVGFAVNTKIF